MKILDRYVGMMVFTTSLFAVGVLSLVLVLGNIFRRVLDLLVNHDVPMEFILSFIAYVLPFSLSFTIPWGVLTSILLVFGRLSAENELTAMRACGVGVGRIALPVFVFAVICSLICLWINVDVAPRAQMRMKNSLVKIATSNPIALFGSDRIINEFPGKKIYVGQRDGMELRDILIFELNEENTIMRVIRASRGVIETGSENAAPEQISEIKLRLFDARYEQRDENEPHKFAAISQGIILQEGVTSISLSELFEKSRTEKGLGAMTLAELRQDLHKSTDAASESAVRTEMSKRFSFSVACIAFALVAIPLGITAQRRETSIGFAISLGIAFVYFLFIIVADFLRNKPAAFPEILVWFPNVLFIGLGIYLLRRQLRK